MPQVSSCRKMPKNGSGRTASLATATTAATDTAPCTAAVQGAEVPRHASN